MGAQLVKEVATKTNVTVNGEHVATFDADTQSDTIDTLKQAVYVYDAKGVNKTVKYTGTEYDDYTFVLRSVNGRVLVGTPSAEHDATTKKYVDDQVSTKTSVTVGGSNVATFNADTKLDKVTTGTGISRVYGIGQDGTNIFFNVIMGSSSPNTIALRNNAGVIVTGIPTEDNHATTKKYVDDSISSATSITILEASDA